MLANLTKKDNTSLKIIIALSVIVPLLVFVLLFLPHKLTLPLGFISILPHSIAVINSLTTIFLIAGLVFIKKKNYVMHQKTMMYAFFLGAIFLATYVLYHASAPSTYYGDLNGDGTLSASELETAGGMRIVYITVLLSHILLSIVVLPLVLFAVFYAYKNDRLKHRKVVKFAYPIWLYVSVSGVVIYFMIKPFYNF